jgi:hypothetical protein
VSRPIKPSYTVPTWAPNTNYPVSADPWSATPTKTAHAGAASVGITPKTAVPAQVINKLINDAYATDGLVQVAVYALFDYLAQSTALNFGAQVTTPATFAGAAWDASTRAWYYTATAGKLYASFCNGYVFGSNLISAVAAGTESLRFIDCDGNGVIIAACNTASIFRRPTAAGAWSKVATGGTYSIDAPGIVYDPIHASWCWVGVDAGAPNTTQVYTSTAASAGAAWTNRSGSLALAALNLARVGVNKTTGRIVIIAGSSATRNVSTSDDGGITWTARTSLTVADPSYTEAEIFHNAATGKWLFITGKTGTCDVWTSSDGITWARAVTLATAQILRAVPDGFLWCGVTAVGDIVYSVDDGATWKFTGYQAGSAARGMFSGNGGFMCVSTAVVSSSFVASLGGANVT